MSSSNNAYLLKNTCLPEKNPEKIASEEKMRLPTEAKITSENSEKRARFLHEKTGKDFPFLSGASSFTDYRMLEGNIEN